MFPVPSQPKFLQIDPYGVLSLFEIVFDAEDINDGFKESDDDGNVEVDRDEVDDAGVIFIETVDDGFVDDGTGKNDGIGVIVIEEGAGDGFEDDGSCSGDCWSIGGGIKIEESCP